MHLNSFSKVVTANDLRSGEVIYMIFNGGWVDQLSDATVITDPDLAKASLAFAEGQSDVAVGAYLSNVTDHATGPTAIHFRDKFRSQGPSNYAHGKQEI
jgi:hypothetical protein